MEEENNEKDNIRDEENDGPNYDDEVEDQEDQNSEEDNKEENSEEVQEEKEENVQEKEIEEKKAETVEEEKEEEKKEENAPAQVIEDKKEEKGKKKLKKSTIAWIVFGVILVLVVALLVYLYVVGEQHKESTFMYNDFNFRRTPLGEGFVYETPLIFVKNGNPYEYIFKFRTDPRELGLIPANVSRVLTKNYFSFTPDTTNCSGNALIAAFQIGQFLDAMSIEVEPAVTENFSGNNITVANCSSALEFGVIELRPFSNQSRIYTDEQNPSCVIIEAQNCSVVEASERYILAIIEAYRKPNQFKDLFENFSR